MELNIEKMNYLIIEAPKLYREIVQNLRTSIYEDNEEWIFSDNEKILKKAAVLDVIDSIFSLDFGSRKIQGAIAEQAYRKDTLRKQRNWLEMLKLIYMSWNGSWNMKRRLMK